MPLEIVRNDITKMDVDAIVNAANTELKRGGGVCGAIFASAGADELRAECDRIGFCRAGAAVLTKGYALPAKYIIHTVGPIWQGGNQNEENLLKSCYLSALNLALKYRCACSIGGDCSSGIFGYPKDQALQAAIAAIGSFLLKHEMLVYLVVYDSDSYVLSDKLLSPIRQYIDDRYVEERARLRFSRRPRQEQEDRGLAVELPYAYGEPSMAKAGSPGLDGVAAQLEETFSQTLLRLIDASGNKDADIYKKANVSRKLFSKIRGNKAYQPSKGTVLAFAIALELTLEETAGLLRTAGFALSRSSRFDLIVEYFITQGNYNIFEINEALFAFDQPLLSV